MEGVSSTCIFMGLLYTWIERLRKFGHNLHPNTTMRVVARMGVIMATSDSSMDMQRELRGMTNHFCHIVGSSTIIEAIAIIIKVRITEVASPSMLVYLLIDLLSTLDLGRTNTTTCGLLDLDQLILCQ